MSSTPPIDFGEHGRDSDVGRQRRRNRSSRASPKRYNLWELLPAAILVAVALIFGGSANPLADLVIELLAVIVLAISFIRFNRADWALAKPGMVVIAIAAIVALIELVPLPYAIWRTLPGRQDPTKLLDMLSLASASRQISLDPNATISSLLKIIPGIAVFIATITAGEKTKSALIWLIISGAILCVFLGILQMLGQSQFYMYQESHFGNVTGVFANRDHTADMLLIGIALLLPKFMDIRPNLLGLKIILAAVLVATCISVPLTASRFGIFLLLGEILIVAIYFRESVGRFKKYLIPAILIIGALSVWLLMFSTQISSAIDRFNDLSIDLRPQIWRHTLLAVTQYWPIGSGLGTFVPVYQSFESIDGITIPIVNHAHNEYLELVLELGAIGVILIAGYLVTMGRNILLFGRGLNQEVFVSLVGIAILLLHSAVDFPLRNEALLVTFGILNGIVFAAVRKKFVDKR